MSLSPEKLEALRYPIGKYEVSDKITDEQVSQWKNDISTFPVMFRELVSPLSDDQLKYIYRPEGWNIRQLVHHCADSHMNAFIRFKWALTEDIPTIKPYIEEKWAMLPDSNGDIDASLSILDGVHHRWSILLTEIGEQGLKREFRHPDSGNTSPLEYWLGMYSWHARHHTAHIRLALSSEGKF